MNTALMIEIAIFAVLIAGGILLTIRLRRILRSYDGLGEIKKETPRRPKPAEKTLG